MLEVVLVLSVVNLAVGIVFGVISVRQRSLQIQLKCKELDIAVKKPKLKHVYG